MPRLETEWAAAVLAGMMLVFPVSAQAPTPTVRAGNYMDLVSLPPDQQDQVTREYAAMLASGVVKTASDALRLGMGVTPRADEVPAVTGLFYVETAIRPVNGVTRTLRDLVWEVRIVSLVIVRRVYWISVRTGEMTQIFPKRESSN